jgi:hypothetical protein
MFYFKSMGAVHSVAHRLTEAHLVKRARDSSAESPPCARHRPQQRRPPAAAIACIATAITIAAVALLLASFSELRQRVHYVWETATRGSVELPLQHPYSSNSLVRLVSPLLLSAAGSNDSIGDLNPAASELLAVREQLYLGEVYLLTTEHALANFRRREDLAEVSKELNAAHKAVMRCVRELADKFHTADEETGRVSNSVQTAAREVLLGVYRAARAITLKLDSREQVRRLPSCEFD